MYYTSKIIQVVMSPLQYLKYQFYIVFISSWRCNYLFEKFKREKRARQYISQQWVKIYPKRKNCRRHSSNLLKRAVINNTVINNTVINNTVINKNRRHSF
jgi:hypothetical protein